MKNRMLNLTLVIQNKSYNGVHIDLAKKETSVQLQSTA